MAKKQSIEDLVKIELKDCRFHADCMALKVKEFRKYDKYFNIFVALTSSGGITSWIVNNDWGIYCGGAIALSQLVNALKPLFTFSKHIHTLNTRCYKQEALFLELDMSDTQRTAINKEHFETWMRCMEDLKYMYSKGTNGTIV